MPVTLHDVGHRFDGGPWLFRGLNLEFRAGRVYALTGPSGSGKSTLLSLLARLEHPREGIIGFEEVSRVNWVFQNPSGAPRRSACDHVMLPLIGAGMDPIEAKRAAIEWLRRFRLGPTRDRPFRELSGGEAQRLMLARGMASKPDLLLVDEPTAQLDRETAAHVDAVLGSLSGSDAIVVIATHDENTRDACTDHIDLADRAQRVKPL